MTRSALVVGRTGCLQATVELHAWKGWQVTVTGRTAAAVPQSWSALGVAFVAIERGDEASMTALLAGGGSLLVDGQCYTPEHARELSTVVTELRLGGDVVIQGGLHRFSGTPSELGRATGVGWADSREPANDGLPRRALQIASGIWGEQG